LLRVGTGKLEIQAVERTLYSTCRILYYKCIFGVPSTSKVKYWYLFYRVCLSGLVEGKETQGSLQKTEKHTDKTKHNRIITI
jgi:hypothetical protein